MSKSELAELLSTLEMSYPFFEVTEEKEQAWFEILHYFSYEDVKRNLDIAMGEDRFQKDPPQASYLIQGLIPISKKMDFENRVVFCQICKRAINHDEEKKHLDRCRSIRYITKQYKKYSGKELNKRTLWEMSQEEFDNKYNELLRFNQKHTTDERERMRIEFIFNPPEREVAKRFINNGI